MEAVKKWGQRKTNGRPVHVDPGLTPAWPCWVSALEATTIWSTVVKLCPPFQLAALPSGHHMKSLLAHGDNPSHYLFGD